MKQKDPTLSIPDSDLVARIKAEQDSVALTTLLERHSGIYFKVVNSYAATYPNVIKRAEMDDDKMFNLYSFILAYDPNRGTKLSTFICDRTDYLCKTLLRRDERNPLSYGYVASGSSNLRNTEEVLPMEEDTYSSTHGARVTLVDESVTSCVPETANADLAFEDIRRAAAEVCTDPRFLTILDFRHFNAPRCALSWRDIGARLELSHERVRQIYTENIELIRNHLLAANTP